ncbi:hypothetical protein Tco_1280647, partial [Tanacetum coccineum]
VLALVTNITQKDKNEAKWTKPSTGMERVQEIKAEVGNPKANHWPMMRRMISRAKMSLLGEKD